MMTPTLTEKQCNILRAYAMQCHPHLSNQKDPDLEYLKDSGFIDRQQDHITDRGAAYVCGFMDFGFTKFIGIHSNWMKRKTRITFDPLGLTPKTFGEIINFGKRYFPSKEEQDIYFKERYKVLLKYDSFSDLNSEQIPPDIAAFLGEMLLGMLNYPSIDWRQVKKMLQWGDKDNSLDSIDNKADLQAYIKSYLNYKLERNYNASDPKP